MSVAEDIRTADAYLLISQAQAAYVRCIDDENAQNWPSFFTDDCVYVITTSDNHAAGLEAGIVYANSRGMLSDRISALNEANIYEQQSYRHVLGQPHILARDGNLVDSETSFIVARIMRDGDISLFATGRYVDRYLIEDGKALLKRRIVICDSKAIDTLLALPL